MIQGKCSPLKLMLGRDDLLIYYLGRPPQEETNLATPYAESLQQTLETVHEFARSSRVTVQRCHTERRQT